MAESLADVKITAATDAEAKQLIRMLSGQGGTNIRQLTGYGPGGQKHLVTAQAPTANIPNITNQIQGAMRGMTNVPVGAGAGVTGFANRLKQTFTMKNAKEMNKSLFMMQMASLGVAFSFMSIIGQMTGLFSGLEDLGAMISGGAIGSAFAGIATGGEGTNIAASMGVTTEMQTAAWAGFTAIVNQFKAVFDALAVKVLTPEMVGAILAVIDAIALTLADPSVVKALQEIIKAVLEIVIAFMPLIPVIADVVNWLGETGLLKFLLLIIVAAEILLPTLAYLQFMFTGVMTVVTFLTGAATLLAVPLWAVFAVVGIIILVIDVLIHFFENLSSGMDVASAFTNALGQTLADFVNIIIGVYNTIASVIPGMSKMEQWSTNTGQESGAYTKAQTTVNNITFSKNVGTKSKTDITKAIKNANSTAMG